MTARRHVSGMNGPASLVTNLEAEGGPCKFLHPYKEARSALRWTSVRPHADPRWWTANEPHAVGGLELAQMVNGPLVTTLRKTKFAVVGDQIELVGHRTTVAQCPPWQAAIGRSGPRTRVWSASFSAACSRRHVRTFSFERTPAPRSVGRRPPERPAGRDACESLVCIRNRHSAHRPLLLLRSVATVR